MRLTIRYYRSGRYAQPWAWFVRDRDGILIESGLAVSRRQAFCMGRSAADQIRSELTRRKETDARQE